MSTTSAASGPHAELVHVHARTGVEHGSAFGERDDSEGVALAARSEAGAVDRVHRDVDLGPVAVTDVLAVVEHRRFVLLALADDDNPVDADRSEHVAHRVDGGLVGGFLVAAADPSSGAEGRGFRDPDELHREIAIGRIVPIQLLTQKTVPPCRLSRWTPRKRVVRRHLASPRPLRPGNTRPPRGSCADSTHRRALSTFAPKSVMPARWSTQPASRHVAGLAIVASRASAAETAAKIASRSSSDGSGAMFRSGASVTPAG